MEPAVVGLLSPYVKLRRSGERWWVGSCPFHRDRKPSFAVNTDSGYWLCHSCHQRGSLRRLLRQLGQSLSSVNRLLEPIQGQLEAAQARSAAQSQLRFRKNPFRGEFILPEGILGAYDYDPVDLIEQGFRRDLLRALDIGFDRYQERITFPLRDLYGNLVGVSGRTVVDEEPKYRVYHGGYQGAHGWVTSDFGPNFDEEFPGYQINVGRYLWYGQEAIPSALASPPDEPFVIVEGFKACLWVLQAGFPYCSALLGSTASTHQVDLLRRLGNPIVIFLDANEAGRRGTRKLAEQLSLTHEVRVVDYPAEAGKQAQPDSLSPQQVTKVIEKARRVNYVSQQVRTKNPPLSAY